jgi:hypothetical protein
MARATRAAPVAATRVGGITIAPAASAVLVTAIVVAVAMAAVVVAAIRSVPGGVPIADPIVVGGANGATTRLARTNEPRFRTTSATVPDVPWLAERGDGAWLYGHGTNARILPVGEFGLAIDDHALATSTPASNGRSTIHIRSAATGARVRDIAAPIWVSAAAWTSRGLVATGYRDASMREDGGLVLISPTGAIDVLVAAGPFSSALGRPVARGDVVVSPSRHVVGSNACGLKLCDRQVVDLSTGTIFRPSRSAEGFLRAVTDDLVVTTDDDARWISARRFGDGGEAWRLTDTVLLDPMAAAGDSIVGVVGSRATGWGVDRIDATGSARRVTARVVGDAPWPHLWPKVSTPSVVVIGRAGFDEAIGSATGVDVDVVGMDPSRPTSAAARFVLMVGSEPTT